jgi:hypothetical protein
MSTDRQTLWTLATGTYPVVSAHEYDDVVRTYGPAFGPWIPALVGYGGPGLLTVLAVGGNTDPVKALTAVAEEWRRVSDADPGNRHVAECPDQPTAGDVATKAPQGLLIRQGIARLFGGQGGREIPADLPLQVSFKPKK